MRELVDILAGDDPGFVEAVLRLLDEQLVPRPDALHVVRLDNWFGPKWLHFQGKALGGLGCWEWSRRVVPPFHPHRVVREQRFELRERGYEPVRTGRLQVVQHSADNFRRWLPGTCVWLSGATRQNGRGAAMVYRAEAEGSDWYATFSFRSDAWVHALVQPERLERRPPSSRR